MTEINVRWGGIDPEGAELTPGHRYKVSWEDCCTSGGFKATLVSVNRSADDEESVNSVTFDNGVTCDGVCLTLDEVEKYLTEMGEN